MTQRPRTALVTGASSGIGAAFAEVLARRGFDIVVTARGEAPLRELADRVSRRCGVAVIMLPCDLGQPGAASRICAELDARGLQIDALVNSAGFGLPGTYTNAEWSAYAQMLQVMVSAPSELTYRLLPGMLDRGYGRIVNVASLAGLVPAGAGTMYSATKAFAVSFSVSLAREVAGRGVNVTAVCPGLTRSAFHQAPGLRETVRGMPRWMWMDAATVAERGVDAVMAAKSVYVPGAGNRIFVAALRYVPRPVLKTMASALRHVARTASGTLPHRVETAKGDWPADGVPGRADESGGRS